MTLTEQLNARREEARNRIPPDKLAMMDRATSDLQQSGITASNLKESDTAPDFALPNAVGKPVSSKELLKNGPVVLSFYRGGW
jgi:hypothetical protein